RHLQPLADIGAIPLDRQRRDTKRRTVDIEIVDETARPQHVRITKEVLRTVDRRKADIEAIELFREVGDVPAFDDVSDARNDARARQDSICRRPQTRIIRKLPHTKLPTEALPVAFGDDTNEDTPVLCIEDVVDRPGVLA